MTDPASPPAAVTGERIGDDQIQYRTMILRGTGNPITADLIEGLARERAAAESRLARANEARDRLFRSLRMVSCWFTPFDNIEALKPSLLASTPESSVRMRRAVLEDADRLVIEFAPIVDAKQEPPTPPTPPAQSADKCEWRFDGRGSIFCSCGATGRADPQHWQILAISCDDDTKCRSCGKIVKLIAPKAGDV